MALFSGPESRCQAWHRPCSPGGLSREHACGWSSSIGRGVASRASIYVRFDRGCEHGAIFRGVHVGSAGDDARPHRERGRHRHISWGFRVTGTRCTSMRNSARTPAMVDASRTAEGSVCIGLRAFAGVLQSFFPFKCSSLKPISNRDADELSRAVAVPAWWGRE
jgi:hypothetical protein